MFNILHFSNFSDLSYVSDNTTMQFGGLISTSNTYEDSEVTVNTDTSVIWTMGIECLRESTNNETSLFCHQ